MGDGLHTLRMVLVPANDGLLGAALESDEALGNALGVKMAEGWTEFGREPFKYALTMMQEDQHAGGWINYFPVLQRDQTLVGNGGFKGKPNDEGWVEIGYEIAPGYRNQGLATEFAMALIDFALASPNVTGICAHTLAEENASCAVLRKCGFEKTAELVDPDDGPIWRWEWVNT
jgi:RimJ/RimL family protein N-acetyltransferase